MYFYNMKKNILMFSIQELTEALDIKCDMFMGFPKEVTVAFFQIDDVIYYKSRILGIIGLSLN